MPWPASVAFLLEARARLAGSLLCAISVSVPKKLV